MTQPHSNGARASYIALANYLILALGLWLVAAPIVLGFLAGTAGSNSLVIGLAVAVVALLLLRRGREVAGLSALTLGFGLWTILAPFLLSFAHQYAALWSHLFSGAMLAVLAAFSLGEELGIE
ncbi:MAG: SPW repeat protein [Truepera sp.]|nr:SPW repeat protein [Truepera sp.]